MTKDDESLNISLPFGPDILSPMIPTLLNTILRESKTALKEYFKRIISEPICA
jgi:hypothetical protein